MSRRRRKHHPATVVVLGAGVLLAADLAARALPEAWKAAPWLLAAAGV
jgi:hypothetical protein